VIFAVDSADTNRLLEAKTELWRVLEAPELQDAILLVFANKQDLPNAMNTQQIADGLGVEQIHTHPYHVQPCCATDGTGLDEGFDWLAERIKQK
jgi:signal recognition particle receptor subunit beta